MVSWRRTNISQDNTGSDEERPEGTFNYRTLGIVDVEENDITGQESRFSSRRVNSAPSRSLPFNKKLKAIVEEAESHNNQNFKQKVMNDSRIVIDEKQFIGRKAADIATKELEQLAVSNQHIPTKGRGDAFGRMRSANSGGKFSMKVPVNDSHNNNNNYSEFMLNPLSERISVSHELPSRKIEHADPAEEFDPLTFQSPYRYRLESRISRQENDQSTPKHQFDPSTAYSGIVTPDYRYNYKPEAVYAHALPANRGLLNPVPIAAAPSRSERYPKRPENAIVPSAQPKPLSHNYYNINLYGKTQEERTAQRIEKTVRQTEAPPPRF